MRYFLAIPIIGVVIAAALWIFPQKEKLVVPFPESPQIVQPAFGASGTIFNDTFTEASSDTNLDSHTPDTGTSWTSIYNPVGDGNVGNIDARSANDNAAFDQTDNSEGRIYSADATYSSADYLIEWLNVTAPTSDESLIVCARINASNQGYCGHGWWADNHDPIIYETSGFPTCAALATHDSTNWVEYGNNATTWFQVVGNEIGLYRKGIETTLLFATDTTYTAAGKAALGMGQICVAGEDTSTTLPVVDDFIVYELADTKTGWNNPTTNGEISNNFTNPTDAYSSNDVYATETSTTQNHDYGDFGFSIPSGDTIRGIEVKLEMKTNDTFDYANIGVEVSNDNGATWSAQKLIRIQSTTDITQVAGHGRSLWGLTWTPTDLNDTDFRVRIQLESVESGTLTFSLDHVSVKVFHDAGAAAQRRVIITQ